LYHSPATVEGNTILTNTALLGTGTYNGGGGLYLDTSAATIRNNVIQDNYGQPYGGGLFVYSSAATISGNAIEDNTAHHGGGLFVAQSPAQLQANTIVDNRATIGTAGLEIFQSNPFTMTNNVIALNLSLVAFPGALYSHNSWGTLVHNTFMENHPVPLPIGCVNGSTLAFTNTIFGPPGGIWVDGSSSVMLDTTLWFPQGIPTVAGLGTIVSSTNLYGDPRFYGPAFHIAFGSAAIDAGAPTWVTTDIDGDPRPYGSYPDIGADEFQGAVFVPLVMKSY
jgi:hypothetical protein